MTKLELRDSDIECVLREKYDVAVYASGYEPRCTHVPQLLPRCNLSKIAVLGFSEKAKEPPRVENDRFFEKELGIRPMTISADDERGVYDIIRNETADIKKDKLRLLIDYSSMSKLWYAGLLNWARYADIYSQIEIDMVYAIGKHQDSISPLVISSCLSIPGCQGSAMPDLDCTAIFGLGFDGMASLCVYDQLEPDHSYAFYAKSSDDDPNAVRAIRENETLMQELGVRRCFPLPLKSV